MPEMNIPGVTDSYKTKDLIASLMEVERIPRNRANDKLEEFKTQQTAWRTVNQQMTKLRDTARSLYSYNNPFSEKLAESSDENALTATAGKEASFETAKIRIERTATADRFLSRELPKKESVPEGKYVFTVADKLLTMNWKGGTLADFAAALNRRSNNLIKASVLTISKDSQSIMIESLKTGAENRLSFEDAALDFALGAGILKREGDKGASFGLSVDELRTLNGIDKKGITADNGTVTVPPRSGAALPLPAITGARSLEFFVNLEKTTDITEKQDSSSGTPVLGSSGSATFRGIRIDNQTLETGLGEAEPVEPEQPVTDLSVLFLRKKDGTEVPLAQLSEDAGKTSVSLNLADYENAESLVVRNNNTGYTISISGLRVFDPTVNAGYVPINAVETAGDARFTYQGITVERSTNEVDDLIPGVTLKLEAPTEKPVTLTIKPNTDAAKEAIISVVGNYNRLMAELNILTQQKPEIIAELDYLTDDERESAEKRLGMFTGDFTLVNEKNNLQRIMAASYRSEAGGDLSLLEQIGISTKSGANTSYSAGQYRGYLEIDEKKLDAALKDNMDAVKILFGFDANGDLVVDSGAAYSLDSNLQSFVQIGGIIATKSSGLDSQVRTTQAQIKKMDEQLALKEQELKRKYGSMEGSLNNLQSQSNTIDNFSNQQNGGR